MKKTSSTRVISICSLKHADVWKLTSRQLPKFIEADEFVVYVPEEELGRFLEITDPAIQVLSQSVLDLGFSAKLRSELQARDNVQRFGWYLQQFYKIQALLLAEADYLVIWDADCVPVRYVKLFDENWRPVYMRAAEYNPEYFHTIERLLGLARIQNQSFVIPGFPIPREWANEFIRNIELRHIGSRWFDAIISSTDLSQTSGFSETETLGTWIANLHPDSWTTSDVAWERFGQSRFGYARDFTPDDLVAVGENASLDIITFENWDLRGLRKNLRRLRRLFLPN